MKRSANDFSAADPGQSTPKREEYHQVLANLRNGSDGQWVAKAFSWTRAFGSQGADMLLFLLNASQFSCDGYGWVRATPKTIEARMGWKPEVQAKILGRLEERGLVEVMRKFTWRMVRVNLAAVEQALRQAEAA